jgi:Tfp pilus assembly protein FimT
MKTNSQIGRRRTYAGFTMIELCIVVTIGLIVMGFAIPIVATTVSRYRLNGAVSALTGAIRTTRYQALMKGYRHRLAISPTNRNYQVSQDPEKDGTFTNLGSAIPFTGASTAIVVSAATTLEFRPNGQVAATTGDLDFDVTYSGNTKTITVTTYGNVTVE